MTGSYAYLLVKALISLVFVLGLLGASLYALKYYMRRSGRSPKGSRFDQPVKVLSTTFLGQKKNLSVVEVAGELILIGVTPTSITFLTKIESPEAVEEIKRNEGSRKNPFLGLFH